MRKHDGGCKVGELTLKSVYDLLDKNYFIPSYQRGYRWGKRQVQDLLEDLYAFAIDGRKPRDSFYCLQPIVVKECDAATVAENSLQSALDKNIWYEVIDGQQRLTTIYLLLKYLINADNIDMRGDYGKELFRISYQTHGRDEDCINEPSRPSNVSPNAYYITQGYKNIADWFASLPETNKKIQQIKSVRTMFWGLLTNTKDMHSLNSFGYVQVIWYKTDDDDPIKTFTRLNIGKIPLKNAELIKALFLQKRDDDPLSSVQQIQIAKEWDQIEAALQDGRIWAFLNEGISDIPAHIELIFQVDGEKKREALGEEEYIRLHGALVPDQKLKPREAANQEKEKEALGKKKFEELYGTDEFASFRYFCTLFENASRDMIDEQWGRAREYYETFLEWYRNPLWYHYIGFLIYCGTPILEIYHLYEGKTKKEFESNLVEAIRSRLEVNLKVSADDTAEITTKNGDPIIYDNKTKTKLRQLLVLYNIEYIVQKNRGVDRGYLLFPFDLFKSENWDIEHVDSYTTNPLNQKDQQLVWLTTVLQDLDELHIGYRTSGEITDAERTGIEEFLSGSDTAPLFGEIMAIVSKLAGEYSPSEEVRKEIKNKIGNLTLLNADVNRGYGNAIYPSKRKEIIQKDAEGRFIPLCTKNVFLKNFIGVGNTSVAWSADDMEHHQRHIISVIGKFLMKDEKGGKK